MTASLRDFLDDLGEQARRPPVSRPHLVRAYTTMNTLRALELLAFHRLSIPEIAESLQISVTTTRRLLRRLALDGFVAQEGGNRRRYYLTLRLAALGHQLLEHSPVVQAARPVITDLAQATGCAAHVWIPAYDQKVLCVAHAERHGAHLVVLDGCGVAPALSSAAGIVLRNRSSLSSFWLVETHNEIEPAVAAAVAERHRIVAALGLTGPSAHHAVASVSTAAIQLSRELSPRALRPRPTDLTS